MILLVQRLLITSFLAIIATLLILANHFPGVFKEERSIPCSGCNIVIIDIDTLRADALSCLGSIRNTSPNICEFFKKGVIFEQNIAQSDWTLPSIFSTITSQYPFTHGVYQAYQDKLSQNIPTLAENLKSFGYQTTWVGSTGIGWGVAAENGGLRGFDKIIDTPFRDASYWEEIARTSLINGQPSFIYFYSKELHLPYALENGETPIENLEKPEGFPVFREEFLYSFAEYLKTNSYRVFTDRAREEHPEIFNHLNSIDKFAVFNYYYSLDPNKDVSNNEYLAVDWWNPVYESYTRHIYSDDKEDQSKRINYVRMLYDTRVNLVDNELLNLLKFLTNPEISKNTIVVLLSEHGEEFMEHGQFAHYGNLYQELIHTPLMVRIPNVSPRRVSKLTENIDIFPTLMEVVGIPPTGKTAGISLLPLMKGAYVPENQYAISFIDYHIISIQNERWKLIADFSTSPKPIELYDIKSDPREQDNLIEEEKQKTNELLKILIEKIEESKTFPQIR